MRTQESSFDNYILDVPEYTLLTGATVPLVGFEGVSYEDLFSRYAGSIYGSLHATTAPRYSKRYGYEPERMVTDLGPDVHPVEHMRYTHDEVMQGLMLAQNTFAGDAVIPFTRSEIVIGRIVPYFHDMGECEHPDIQAVVGKTVGDMPWGNKTEADEAAEKAVRRFIFDTLYPDVPRRLIDAVENTIEPTIDTHISEAFNVAERAGYYRTAMRAGYIALHEKRNRDLGAPQRDNASFLRLSALALNVSMNHNDVLTNKAVEYPYAGFIVSHFQPLNEAIHMELPKLT